MENQNAVYQLIKSFDDDPRFEGFAPKVRGDLPDSFPQNRRSRKWRVYRFAKWWKPMKVVGRVRPFNDNPGMMLYPVFSKRAVDALRNFLKPNDEILPLSSPVGSYYLINVTTVADVLNWRKSKVVWFIGEKPIAASNILDYQFFRKKLEGRSIFRIPESVTRIFVTEEFAQRVREHGLIGFQLVKVWPLPPGTDYMKLHTEQKLHKPQLPNAPTGKTCKGNMVIIHLNLADPKSKGNKTERAQIKRLEDQLDALLVNDSMAPPVGNLEGHDFKAGKCRMVLSCPDANALEKKITPLLKKLDWPNGFTIKKHRKHYEELQDWWD
jgi:hypothetical protein